MSYINTPLVNKKLPLKNRIVLPPMATAKSDESGKVSQALLDYYDEKSQGGYIGLIITEHSFIDPQGKAHPGQVSIAEDSVLDGMTKLAQTIHKNGSMAIVQMNHAGSATNSSITGMEVVGPSAVQNTNPNGKETPRELTIDEIHGIIKSFVDAARRVKAAGFDGVEIHSAHTYLLNQFYSPITNKRTDEYGGDLSGRIKIHLDVIKAVRSEVGEDFPILLRLGACDYMDGGSTMEDSVKAAVEFEKAGVDLLDISGGLRGYNIPGVEGQGYFKDITKAIKRVVSIPVILTGGITEAKAADELIASGQTDLVGVGRALLKDSEWAKKAIESLNK